MNAPFQLPPEAHRYRVVNDRSRLECGPYGEPLRVVHLWWTGSANPLERFRVDLRGTGSFLFDLGARVAPHSPVWLPVFRTEADAKAYAACPDIEVAPIELKPNTFGGFKMAAWVALKWAPWPIFPFSSDQWPQGIADVDLERSLEFPGLLYLCPLYLSEADLLADFPIDRNPTIRPATLRLSRPLPPPAKRMT